MESATPEGSTPPSVEAASTPAAMSIALPAWLVSASDAALAHIKHVVPPDVHRLLQGSPLWLLAAVLLALLLLQGAPGSPLTMPAVADERIRTLPHGRVVSQSPHFILEKGATWGDLQPITPLCACAT